MPCFQKTDTIRPFRDFSQDHPQARPGWCATLHACSSAAPPRASLAVRCSLAAPMSEPHRLPLAAPIIVVSTGLISDAHHSMRGSDIAGTDARQALGRFLPSGHLMVFCTSWSFWPHGLFPPRGDPSLHLYPTSVDVPLAIDYPLWVMLSCTRRGSRSLTRSSGGHPTNSRGRCVVQDIVIETVAAMREKLHKIQSRKYVGGDVAATFTSLPHASRPTMAAAHRRGKRARCIRSGGWRTGCKGADVASDMAGYVGIMPSDSEVRI